MWMDRSPNPLVAGPEPCSVKEKENTGSNQWWYQVDGEPCHWSIQMGQIPDLNDEMTLSVRPLYGFCHQQTKVPHPTHHAGSLSHHLGRSTRRGVKARPMLMLMTLSHTHIYTRLSLSLSPSTLLDAFKCLWFSTIYGMMTPIAIPNMFKEAWNRNHQQVY